MSLGCPACVRVLLINDEKNKKKIKKNGGVALGQPYGLLTCVLRGSWETPTSFFWLRP